MILRPRMIPSSRDSPWVQKALSSAKNLLKAKLKKPSLPKALQASEGQEPILKVFIQEENRVEEMKLEDYIKMLWLER